MATDDLQTSRDQYAELIWSLQDLKIGLEPLLVLNSKYIEALSYCLKDVPDNDAEIAQSIVQGLCHFHDIDERIVTDIETLQRSLIEKEVQ